MDVGSALLLLLWHQALTMLQWSPAQGHYTTVMTDKGRVRGMSHMVDGQKVDVFLGIPYARPPIGELRFLHPEQIDPWSDVWDATKKPNCCMQIPDMFFGNFSGSNVWNPNTEPSEDCLYLNVWTPRTRPPYTNKAVMVWVYGGAFTTGSSVLDIYDGKYLAIENDVIVVSMQFRFGALGYFVLGSPDSPGNAGMMDLRMALEWVQRNIHYFGGNAHNVTLVGESSGAVSIGLLMLSSLGRGLFNRAILQSGAPQAPWGTYSLKEGRRRSKQLAELLGCDPRAPDWAILECLRSVPARKFPETETKAIIVEGIAQFPFIPVIDGVFLTKSPREYLKEGSFKKIPLLLGSNANEGSWLLVYTEPELFNLNTDSLISRENYNSVMDNLFKYYPQYPQRLNALTRDAIKFKYTDWLDPYDQVRLRGQVEKAVGDFHFTCGVAELAKTFSQFGQDVYLYRFSHRMSVNPWPPWMGVLHGDEIYFVFGTPLVKGSKFTEEEVRLSRKMMKLWSNFAKTGNPNRAPGELELNEWPKFQHNEQLYLNISTEMLEARNSWGQGVRPQYCAFLDQYVPKLAQMEPSSFNPNCSQSSASTSATAPVVPSTLVSSLCLAGVLVIQWTKP